MRPAALLLLLSLAAPAAAQDPARAARDLGLFFDQRRPLDVRADELEAVRAEDGADRVVFRGAVQALQDETKLSCDWLEALYPKGGGAPEQLTARGNVQVAGNQSRMSCEELVYQAGPCLLTCRSAGEPATVERGEDVLRGREIEVDLCRNSVRVRGGASIRVGPEAPAAEAAP